MIMTKDELKLMCKYICMGSAAIILSIAVDISLKDSNPAMGIILAFLCVTLTAFVAAKLHIDMI